MKTKGIYFLYRLLQAFALPVLFLYFLIRGARSRSYFKSLPQRFGFVPRSFKQTGPGAIWLHAVSVGEVLACKELLRRLRERFPRSGLFISTTTLAGRLAADDLGGIVDGVFYAPVDYVFAVRRVLRTIQPSVVIIAETEIWPNLFREAKRIGAGLTIVNGRISDRAIPRYRRFAWFFRAILPQADSILAQTDEIRDRFLELGARPETTQTGGNFKYDFDARPTPAPFLERLPARKTWIAASTTGPVEPGDPDEDDVVIAAFGELSTHHRDLLLILAPRKPERFEVVAQKLQAAGTPFVRRSRNEPIGSLPHVLLLDTIGELSGLFAFADVVFMGGTLPHRGGHNILEPALFGKPVIAGPHTENFRDIAEQFRAAGAFVEIETGAGLKRTVDEFLSSPGRAEKIGHQARVCAEARRGATGRAVEGVAELHGDRLATYRPPMPRLILRWSLSLLWTVGGRRRLARYLRAQRKIDAPVISVGNLTMGGTGKTPCVLRLAEIVTQLGRKPGILTRGYRRSSPERCTVLAPGVAVKPELTGDEPQIFIRSGLAPVGVGADRYESGMRLRHEFGADVMLLDDGFQHLKLARDLDIVLIDALTPFGGGGVFPLGRLREPPEGLARADLILITRSDLADTVPAIERRVRVWNAKAPILRARTHPVAWVDNRTGRHYPIGGKRFEQPVAFCGLGNPGSFLRTLQGMGIEPIDWYEYGDHHRYRPKELRRLAFQGLRLGATALLTTEKDAVNLCESGDDLLAPLPLYWLKITMAIEPESQLRAELERVMRISAV